MAKSTTRRHRADLPVSTPLTGVTETFTSVITPVTAVGKGGVVVAVSSGLVAGVALPGSAALQIGRESKAPTASIPLLAATDATATAVSADVSAAPGAQVTFEHEEFRPVARHAANTPSAASSSREVTEVSRSLARAAYRAHIASTAPAVRRQAAPRPAARATTPTRTHTSTYTSQPTSTGMSGSSLGSSVVAVALRYLGVPYVYGGSSPRGFDCSGFTMYVYGQLGVKLPRTTGAQYNATTHISRSSARPGDLVFFFTGGVVTHVGIYLGGNMMIAAPHTGDVVKKQTIYSANVAFGRV